MAWLKTVFICTRYTHTDKRKHEDSENGLAGFPAQHREQTCVARLGRLLGIRQTERQPEKLVTDRIGIIDTVARCSGASGSKVVVLVRAGLRITLDEEKADDSGAVWTTAPLCVVVAGDVIRAGGVEAPLLGSML